MTIINQEFIIINVNTTAMYDVLAVLCQLKPKSKNIYKLTDIEEVVDE